MGSVGNTEVQELKELVESLRKEVTRLSGMLVLKSWSLDMKLIELR